MEEKKKKGFFSWHELPIHLDASFLYISCKEGKAMSMGAKRSLDNSFRVCVCACVCIYGPYGRGHFSRCLFFWVSLSQILHIEILRVTCLFLKDFEFTSECVSATIGEITRTFLSGFSPFSSKNNMNGIGKKK